MHFQNWNPLPWENFELVRSMAVRSSWKDKGDRLLFEDAKTCAQKTGS
jgi:hypothetical protein